MTARLATPDPDGSPGYMKKPEVAQFFGISTRSLERLVSRGEFPAPVRLGRLVRWPRVIVEDYYRRQQRQR